MQRESGEPPRTGATGPPSSPDLTQDTGALRRFADGLPHLLWTRRGSGDLEFVNAAWFRYAGVPEQLPPVEVLARVIHPDDLQALAECHAEALGKGDAYECEIRARRRDGDLRWHRARVEPVRLPGGQIERWIGSATDVHAVREARERQGHSPQLASALVAFHGDDEVRAQLDALFEGASVGLALLDRELRYVRVNRALALLNGVSPESHLGRTPVEISQHLASTMPLLAEVMRTGVPYASDHFTPFGERMWYVCFYPVRTRGVVTGVAATVLELTERVRAEQGYELVNRATNEALRDWDVKTGETRWNAAISTLFGYGAAEVADDMNWWLARIHVDDRERVATGVERAIKEGAERWADEYRFARRDGTYVRVLDRGWIARDPAGRPTRMVASMFDVSEHRRVETELAAVLDGAQIGFAVFDRDLRYRRINRAMAQINDLPVEAHFGNRLSDMAPWVAPLIEPMLERVRDRGETITDVEVSVMLPPRQGLPGHFLVSYYPWVLEGKVEGIVETVLDITERKRAEEAMALLAEAGRVLAESLDGDATLARVVDLVVPSFGDWCVIHLRRDDGSFAVPAVAHIDPALQARLRAYVAGQGRLPLDRDGEHTYARVMASGRSLFVPESDTILQSIARDAEHLEALAALAVRSSAVVPLPVQGAILGTLSVGTWKGSGRLYDHHDLALAEELGRRIALALDNARLLELSRRERARVDAANRAKDEFLAVVSHELRTPLQAILGWSRVLRRSGLSEEQKQKAIDAIDRNASAQAGLIKDLLDTTRIITGKLQLRVGPAELVQIAEAALDIVRPAAEAKGVRLAFWPEPPVIPLVCDAERVQQVLWNLLSNAVKFTERGGKVDLTVELTGRSQVVITVRDTGRGIGTDFLPHIFDKFRQEDSGTTRQHGGLGLGLAIVRHLVEGHGGTIAAHSDGVGQGAEFVVRLPTRASQAGRVSAVMPGAAPGPLPDAGPRDADLRGLKILIVDDERDARELVAAFLQPTGAVVLTAENSDQALTLVAQQRPDVVVSDIAMPGEDGYDWMRRLRQRPASEGGRTPALALTAYARLEDRTRALLAGYQKHLGKPCEPFDLVTAIAELAGRDPVR
ncbi:PAS domain-containing protein [Nannocystis sp. SCPEA4]|uniref:hybrid sensor histidine kinase/response regulator n=1 Tax=Nannocystis sp. SCPEA4 TaxID=2996787 RepID=UPI0022715E49|nr:PAS domain-containing protein [Nannocystis sp. SCPEA4]MCY1059763.1 PAS domain-containing protein [Nannocystis sp. SCPEA4]